MNWMNYPMLHNYARILTTAPQGRLVETVLAQVQTWQAAVSDTDLMMFQMLHYEVYEALKADAAALELRDMVSPSLHAALHAAVVLDELREGTGCCQPTWECEELSLVPPETRKLWWSAPKSDEEAEDAVMETLEVLMALTLNYPLSLELTQYLVTYVLALELEKVKLEDHPRKETARCIKLAKYLTPWERRHPIAYICHRDGEIFLLDGEIDSGTREDYLNAIRQAEQLVGHDTLKRHLIDRTAQPCFDFELEKAVHIWLGDEYKRWGRLAE